MSKHAAANAAHAIGNAELVEGLRQFVESNYPNVTNEQLYEAVVDVYADVVRANNAQSAEQVSAAISSVFGGADIQRRESPERDQGVSL